MLKREQIPILIVNITAVLFFTINFLLRKNYEFLIYIGVIIFFMLAIVMSNKKINYPPIVFWSLTLWSILHMSGGGLYANGKKLYELMLIPIVGEPYNIFKFDQFVHIIGFTAATITIFYVLKPILNEKIKRPISLSIVVVMAGFGLGALNEIIEFSATVFVPETGVGGYENTALDLVADLIGAIIAMFYISKKEKIYFN